MREELTPINYGADDRFKHIQNFLSGVIIACALLGIIYLIYWAGIMSDINILDRSEQYFEPIASFFNPDDNTIEMYKMTSLKLFALIIPIILVQYCISQFGNFLYRQELAQLEKERQIIEKERQQDYVFQFDTIKKYSICLSIDYRTKDKETTRNKSLLDKVILAKLAKELTLLDSTCNVKVNDVLIFASTDFSKYDLIYDNLMKSLSKITKNIKDKYNYDLIPSITTDAFSHNVSSNKVRREHFEIQSFNLKNKSISSGSFRKKYQHLKHEKYAGTPIGEFAYFANGTTDTYELNLVQKNLSNKLKIQT